MLFLLMALASSQNGPSQAKVGRVTEQSVVMIRNIKKFLNVEFKITECEDEDSEEEEGS